MADDLTPEGKSTATGIRMAALVQHYAETVGGNVQDEDGETIITDLLADLMHYCRLVVIDFDACLSRAEYHFSAEQPGDDDAH